MIYWNMGPNRHQIQLSPHFLVPVLSHIQLTPTSMSIAPITMTVMLFDQHPDGPYMDLIQRAFSPSSFRPVIRQDHYKGKKV